MYYINIKGPEVLTYKHPKLTDHKPAKVIKYISADMIYIDITKADCI